MVPHCTPIPVPGSAPIDIVVGGNFTIRRPQKWTETAKKIDDLKRCDELSIAMPPIPPQLQLVAARLRGLPDRALLGREPSPYLDSLAGLNTTRDADAFYWRVGQYDLSDRMELECENWRHQREPKDFAFEISGSDAQSIKGMVTATLSAANLATVVQARLPVRIAFADQPIEPIAEQMVAEFERVSPRWRQSQKIVESRDAQS